MALLGVILLGILLGGGIGFGVGVALGPDEGGMYELEQAASGMVGAGIGAVVGAILGLAAVRTFAKSHDR